MTTETRTIRELTIYWDAQDPKNEGWAYRVTYTDEHEESGQWDWLDTDNASRGELADSMVELAYQYGLEIDTDSVHANALTDGGFATWLAPETHES